jgi:hypothetical protein
MPYVANLVEAEHLDESSAKLTAILRRLNGVGKERIEWIERTAYPRTDAPAPTMRRGRFSTTGRRWSAWPRPWRPCRRICGS